MARRPLPTLWPRATAVGPVAPPASATATVAVVVVVVGALYLGRDILVPLALAILLSFMLGPIVIRLRRLGLGRIPSVFAVVVLLFVVLLGLGSIVASQVVHLAENLPRYEWNLRAKIRDLPIAVPSGGVVERTTDMLRDLREELEKATKGPEAKGTGAAAEQPVKPVLVQVQGNRWRLYKRCASSGGRWSSRSRPPAWCWCSSSSCCCSARICATASSGWSAPATSRAPPKP